MFCSKCGAKNPENTKYCGGCGLDISNAGIASTETVIFEFYGKNWKGAHVLPFGLWNGSGYYDIAVDKNYVYFIKLPSYSSAFWYGILGLLLLNIIGLFIGVAIGGSKDEKKRASFRSAWINQEGNIVSRLYEGRVFQKITVQEIKQNAVFKRNSLTFNIAGKNYIFKTGTKQFEKFVNATS